MEYNEYRKKLESLKAEIKGLEKKYIDELPFHVDDKIKFKGEFLGWILSVQHLRQIWLKYCFILLKRMGSSQIQEG